MGPLIRLAVALLLASLAAVPARAGEVGRWTAHIAEASSRFGIPVVWIRRVMAAESGGRTWLNGRPIESHAGAMGLMQLMPGTWRAMRSAHGLGADPHDPRDNILAGTAYLRLMYDRFGYPGLFAAYNAGPGAYAAYLAGERRLPAETVAYVARVARSGRPRLAGAGTAPVLAATRGQGEAQALRPTLFAIRAAGDRPPAMGDAEAPERSVRAGASLFVSLRTDRP